MGWLRANRRWTGGLALFALALQLVLAFGHTHLIPAAGAATAIVASASSPAGDPPQHLPDDCAICAVIHLAGTLALPTPVALVLPPRLHILWDDAPVLQHIAAPAAAFQARGPPLS
jgi:hypothetical protein